MVVCLKKLWFLTQNLHTPTTTTKKWTGAGIVAYRVNAPPAAPASHMSTSSNNGCSTMLCVNMPGNEVEIDPSSQVIHVRRILWLYSGLPLAVAVIWEVN